MQKNFAQKSYAYTVQMHFIDPTMNNVEDTILKADYHFVTLSELDYFAYRDTLHLDLPTNF